MTAKPISTLSAENDYELLCTAFDATGMGICFLDDRGIVLRVNPAFCDMLGYPAEEILGGPWTIAAPPDIAAYGQHFIDAILAAHSRIPEE